MFDSAKNRLKWESIMRNPFATPYLKDAIRHVMIPYGISAEKFLVNQECIDNCCERDAKGNVASPSVIATVRDLNYKFSCIRNSSMPLWYYYAFPDVFLWTISDSPSVKNTMNRLEKEAGDNLLDGSGEVAYQFVKIFIEGYLQSTGKRLECKL